MTYKEIEILLEKYYEGETTISEERTLREFFAQDDIPAHLMEHKPLFNFQVGEAQIIMPEFDMEKLTGSDAQEPKVIRMSAGRRNILYITSIAASLLILFGIAYTFQNDIFDRQLSKQSTGELTDPVLAYEQATNALMLVSSCLNTGIVQAEKLQSFSTGLEKTQQLLEYERIQSSIINPDAFK
jgi:hypothetical protein